MAWTLIREELGSFKDQPLTRLIKFLRREFRVLAADTNMGADGQRLILHAQAQLKTLWWAYQPVHTWQRDASLLVKWYVHAHQLATSTTYQNERTPDRPQGHGEAKHMEVLRDAESSLRENGTLAWDTDRVIKAALALLDVYVKQQTTDIESAVTKWKNALYHSFPTVTFRLGPKIMKAAEDMNIGTEGNKFFLGGKVSKDLLKFS